MIFQKKKMPDCAATIVCVLRPSGSARTFQAFHFYFLVVRESLAGHVSEDVVSFLFLSGSNRANVFSFIYFT